VRTDLIQVLVGLLSQIIDVRHTDSLFVFSAANAARERTNRYLVANGESWIQAVMTPILMTVHAMYRFVERDITVGGFNGKLIFQVGGAPRSEESYHWMFVNPRAECHAGVTLESLVGSATEVSGSLKN
jgi:hypothetical protein